MVYIVCIIFIVILQNMNQYEVWLLFSELVVGTLLDKDYLTTDNLKHTVNKIYNDREKCKKKNL